MLTVKFEILEDEDLTQPFYVVVNGEEIFRTNTYARCQRHIAWMEKAGIYGAAK